MADKPFVEVLAPAGSVEGVTAAVQCGAHAIYVGGIGHNARQYAANFTRDQLSQAVSYCHLRGVRVYLALNTLLSDRELDAIWSDVAFYLSIGVDAFIVQDLGLADLLRRRVSGIKLHASTQMAVHNLAGAVSLSKLGFSRVIVARELTLRDISSLCSFSGVEVEVFVHGALCLCHSGQCYMSAVIGRRSGNRGRCAQPCRLPYTLPGNPSETPLSLRDLFLGGHLSELQRAGVASVKIEGRMKRPEYAAVTAEAYSLAIQEARNLSKTEKDRLASVFSRSGFTDAYLYRPLPGDMFGVRETPEPGEYRKTLAEIRNSYRNLENKKIAVDMTAVIQEGTPIAVSISDGMFCGTASGQVPEAARNRPLTEEQISRQLSKTGGTPFVVRSLAVQLEDGLSVPISAVNDLRRQAIEDLSGKRAARKTLSLMTPEAKPDGMTRQAVNFSAPLKISASFRSLEQLPDNLSSLEAIWLPLEEIAHNTDKVAGMMASELPLGAILPRVVLDSEWDLFADQLEILQGTGISSVLAGNLGILAFAAQKGFAMHGDFGLNLFNSASVRVVREFGLVSATLSYELRFAQIADMEFSLPVEIIAYGKLPLMIIENCLMRTGKTPCGKPCIGQVTVRDRKNESFLLAREFGCRNTLYNSKPLVLSDRLPDIRSAGIDRIRLGFTDEDAETCAAVIFDYRQGAASTGNFTRGLYYKGVL
jgi:putative protease